eukprot:UN07615
MTMAPCHANLLRSLNYLLLLCLVNILSHSNNSINSLVKELYGDKLYVSPSPMNSPTNALFHVVHMTPRLSTTNTPNPSHPNIVPNPTHTMNAKFIKSLNETTQQFRNFAITNTRNFAVPNIIKYQPNQSKSYHLTTHQFKPLFNELNGTESDCVTPQQCTQTSQTSPTTNTECTPMITSTATQQAPSPYNATVPYIICFT